MAETLLNMDGCFQEWNMASDTSFLLAGLNAMDRNLLLFSNLASFATFVDGNVFVVTFFVLRCLLRDCQKSNA